MELVDENRSIILHARQEVPSQPVTTITLLLSPHLLNPRCREFQLELLNLREKNKKENNIGF